MTTEKQMLVDALKRYHDCAFTPGVYEHSIVGQAALILENSVEVVHGRWIEDYVYAEDPHDRLRYKCSVCGRTEDYKEPYCNCGAKMD